MLSAVNLMSRFTTVQCRLFSIRDKVVVRILCYLTWSNENNLLVFHSSYTVNLLTSAVTDELRFY